MSLYQNKIAYLLTLAILAGCIPSVSHATTTQQKLEEAIREKNQLQEKIDDHQEHLDSLKDTESDLKKEVKTLNSQLKKVCGNLEALGSQIQDKKDEIEQTKSDLEKARKTEEWQYACIVERVQYMYVQGEEDYLEMFFSMSNYGDFLTYRDFFNAVAEYDKRMLEEFQATRAYIEQEKARLEEEKIELDELKKNMEEEKQKVSGLVNQTSKTISKYGDEISKAEEEALAYEAELKKQEEDIVALRKKIEEEKALSKEAASGNWRDISEITFDAGDRKLLANIIYCEAGNQPYEGQVAVGAVVINRVLSAKFPDTVMQVLYQKNQFSPVRSGRFELALAVDKATPSCYRAADEAMAGGTTVGNCLFFRTPIDGLTGISIGGHIFY